MAPSRRVYEAVTEIRANPAVGRPAEAVIAGTKMSYLTAVPRTTDLEPAPRALTVVSPDARETVYLDDAASLEIITEALKAWGLRVRSERGSARPVAEGQPAPTPLDTTWQTTRPEQRAPSRLENDLSPLWFPLREEDAGDASSAWAWFSRAA